MRCITLTQPWATLVAIGAKRIETRSWRTDYRGPLAIHAAKGASTIGWPQINHICRHTEPFKSVLNLDRHPADALPLGAIVAVCELEGCYPTTQDDGGNVAYLLANRHGARELMPVWGNERAFGDYSPGRFAWVLRNVRALPEPIPVKGALGLWEWEGVL